MIRSTYADLVASGEFLYLLAFQLLSTGTTPPGTLAALVALDAAVAVGVFLRVPAYLA